MKLNLWMIANQLGEYDIETKIAADTERTISGPLPVAAIGCLYVRNEGPDVICQSEQGMIVIHDMDEREGFLLIQSIFNWYDSWIENIEQALKTSDYRMFVHLCAQAFSNPVMLQDANLLLLGMDCRGIPVSRIPQWRFIYEKEQSSVPYYLAMSEALKNPVFKYSDYVHRFCASAKDELGGEYRSTGLHAKFRYLNQDYGYLTILDKKRPLNPGDVALLKLLTEKSSLMLAAADRGEESAVNMRFMRDLLEGKPVPKDQLDYQYSLIARKKQENGSKLCLFLFHLDRMEEKTALIDLLNQVLTRQYPTNYNWTYHDDLLAIACVPEPDILAQQIYAYISGQGYAEHLFVGISLPFDNISDLSCYYEQALFAVKQISNPGISLFYDHACMFLTENLEQKSKLLACEPLCRKIWTEEPDKREFLQTLAVYLRMERSTALAGEQLYIHRNTINYRIKYLREYTNWDYEDAAVRDYLRLSIHYLSRLGETNEK